MNERNVYVSCFNVDDRDDDDINDVATMGGVNLTEESRNILATNSELVSGQLRSCKDEKFLDTPLLTQRINGIGWSRLLRTCHRLSLFLSVIVTIVVMNVCVFCCHGFSFFKCLFLLHDIYHGHGFVILFSHCCSILFCKIAHCCGVFLSIFVFPLYGVFMVLHSVVMRFLIFVFPLSYLGVTMSYSESGLNSVVVGDINSRVDSIGVLQATPVE